MDWRKNEKNSCERTKKNNGNERREELEREREKELEVGMKGKRGRLTWEGTK